MEDEQTDPKKKEEPNCVCCGGIRNRISVYFCFVVRFWSSFIFCKQDALRAADFKEFSPETRESLSCWNPDCIGFNLIESLLRHICENERPGGILVFMTGWDDISSLKDKLQIHPIFSDPNRVMLLACHGSMASFEQVIITFSSDDYLHLMLVLLEYHYCS